MGTVRIVKAGAVDWQAVHEAVPVEVSERMSRAEREADVRILHPGNSEQLQLFEARIEADEEVSLHAHASDEIIYILDGEMRIGRQRLGPGASVFIGGNTLYGFSAGPEGVRFLNFRGSGNTSFITRDEYLADRRALKSPNLPT